MEIKALEYLRDTYQEVGDDEAHNIIALAEDKLSLKNDGELTAKAKKALDNALNEVFSTEDKEEMKTVEDKTQGMAVKKLIAGDFYIGEYKIDDLVPNEVFENKTLKQKLDRAFSLGILEKA